MPDKGWQRRFDEPIPLPKGKRLATLRDAALYITKLPKAEHDAEEWLTAMEEGDARVQIFDGVGHKTK
jgi:hypothetical protein